ncbi:MAG: UDP-3-O-acyl-N-acetylglucosamine deacetylase, partial [Kiloniellaceae bacterium]
PDTGIVFRRTDLANGNWEVRAHLDNAAETPLCTTLIGPGGARIGTIEHLLSALSGCGIDNALIELNGAEVPIMDGSAAPLVFLIECAGTETQGAPRRAMEVLKEVCVSDEERLVRMAPGPALTIGFEIEYEDSAITRQSWSVDITESTYKHELSRARTFGFLRDVDRLRERGLALGGSLDNAVVIDGNTVLNEDGLRYENEFVRHKILDMIGDLYLVGGPILGRAHGVRAGHGLTLHLLRTLLADASAWTWREMTEADLQSAAGASLPARAVAASA